MCLLLPASARPAQPLPQRAYVWQQTGSAEMRAALAAQAGEFAALDVLAGELTWAADDTPRWRSLPLDGPALQATRRPVSLVVRIGPRAGPWEATAAPTRLVVNAVRDAWAAARRAGLAPAELQVDFDAATARLANYRELLRIVREEVAPPRLVFTALPDWLRSADFPALAAEADAYVLQVHSLEKPRRYEDDYGLFSPDRARAWLAQASALGRAFRVALPTYGYRLVFDAAGKFVALEAEGTPQVWPAGHRTRVVMADAPPLAKFVNELLASPPAGCESLVWFRFPISSDELAWRWLTLRRVMRGQVPTAQPALRAQPAANGALDLVAGNEGDADLEPVAFRVEWRDAQLLAIDALAGWRLERVGPRAVIVRPPPHASNGRLRPGDLRHVGWMRLDGPAALTATVLP